MPRLRELVPIDHGQGTCTPSITPKLLTHIDAMQTGGWRAKNRQDGLLMFGCDSGDSELTCLSDLAQARENTYGAGWDMPGFSIRVLRDNSQTKTLYWSRTSADGRYVGSGASYGWDEDPEEDEDDSEEETVEGDFGPEGDVIGGDGDGDELDGGGGGFDGGGDGDGDGDAFLGGQVVDLERGVAIPMDGMYDSAFFPDNSGFMIQAGAGALVCGQSLLSSNPAQITGQEPECRYFGTDQIGIYQMVGQSVGGSDYWAAAGYFMGDTGGFSPTLDNPGADFPSASEVLLTPMLNAGTHFTAGDSTTFDMEDQGDPMLSPSGQLLVTRVKGAEVETEEGWFASEQDGYAIHQLTTQRTPSGLTASVEEIGKVCLEGGKAMLSYDERWMVMHRYVEESRRPGARLQQRRRPGVSRLFSRKVAPTSTWPT